MPLDGRLTLPGLALRVGDEFRDRVHRHRGLTSRANVSVVEARDRDDVFGQADRIARIERHAFTAWGEARRSSVWPSAGARATACSAIFPPGAGTVIDDDRLPQAP